MPLTVVLVVAGLAGIVVLHVRHGTFFQAVERSYWLSVIAVYAAVWGAADVAKETFGWPGYVVLAVVLVVPSVAVAISAYRRKRRTQADNAASLTYRSPPPVDR